jgi:hypothetical protein
VEDLAVVDVVVHVGLRLELAVLHLADALESNPERPHHLAVAHDDDLRGGERRARGRARPGA